jgi:hypothetical protein
MESCFAKNFKPEVMKCFLFGLLYLFYLIPLVSDCQIKTDSLGSGLKMNMTSQLSETDMRSMSQLGGQYAKLGAKIHQSSIDALKALQNHEEKLKSELYKKDSSRAQQLFANTSSTYNDLKAKLNGLTSGKIPVHSLNAYIPGLDSVNTLLKYLKQGNNLGQISADKMNEIQSLSNKVSSLQSEFQKANEIQEFAKQREQQLLDQLKVYGLSKQLLSVNKTIYYYQEQIAQYKNITEDKEKLKEKALGSLSHMPAIQNYIQKNSWLAQLFPTPNSQDSSTLSQGPMTQKAVQDELNQRFGKSVSPVQFMQKQVPPTQSELEQLQDKLANLGSGAIGPDVTFPNFTPNNQKSRTFLKRLELGINFQSQKGSSFLPVSTQIGLSVGYKINDKTVVGFGGAYIMGWGSNIQHIQLSNLGISFRSFIDVKVKGSIWLAGGFEYNYLQAFAGINSIKDLDLWQKSALIGLMKKFKIGKQSSNIQLLYDLLSKDHIPQSSPLIYRFSYSF